MNTWRLVWRFVVYLSAVGFIFAGPALPAQKKPATVAELALYKGSDRLQILEEGAKKEGKLTLYTTGILTQTVRPKVAAFEKKYPFIKVEIWRASTVQLLPRLFEEYMAGKYVVDIVEITQGGQLTLEDKGLLQPFYSPNFAFLEEGAVKEAPGGGAFAAGHYESAYGLGYNTKLITKAEIPKTYEDLLNPKWKGKLAISGDNSGHSWVGVMLATRGEEFVRRMAKQDFAVHMIAAASLRDIIINGEYALSPTIAESHVSGSKKKGAPIEWAPLEPAHVNLGQIVLPKRAPNPHAALLFIEFDLSKETGELYKATGYVSPRKDVPGGATYKRYYGPFSTKQYEQWNNLFNQLFMKK